MVLRSYGFAAFLAAGLSVAAWTVADQFDLPLRDPDSFAGPTYVRLPLIIVIAVLIDVLPRAIARGWSTGGLRRSVVAVVRERWPLRQVQLVLVGLGSWYLTYVAFRNLKSFVPFVRNGVDDGAVDSFDRILLLGRDPADLLHDLLGTGVSAHVLSFFYLLWIVFVPLSLAVAIVWSRDIAIGSWYVTAVAVDWVLGVATYYVLPTLGPIYWEPQRYEDLPDTWVTSVQEAMISDRVAVIADPYGTTAVQTIAAFASLHVGILVTACVIAHLARLSAIVRWTLWIFLLITVVATVYLGWHYLADAFGGVVLGVVGAWLAAIGTGNAHRLRRPRVDAVVEQQEPVLRA